MEEKIKPRLEDTQKTETAPGQKTIEDLLTSQEIKTLMSEVFAKEAPTPTLDFIRYISQQTALTSTIEKLRLARHFSVPAIEAEYKDMPDKLERAYYLWDEQEARKLFEQYAKSLEDTVIMKPNEFPAQLEDYHSDLKEIMPRAEIKPVSEVERFEKILAKVKAQGNSEDVEYFTSKLEQAKRRETVQEDKVLMEKTAGKRSDLLEIMNVIGADKAVLSGKDQLLVKEVAAELPNVPPEPPKKPSLFGRFKKWLNTDDSKKLPTYPEAFLEEPVPTPPQIRRIENQAYKGVPIHQDLV